MNIKNFFNVANFPDYQHIVVVERFNNDIFPLGGGTPDSVIRRFGEYIIKRVAVFQDIIRVEVL